VLIKKITHLAILPQKDLPVAPAENPGLSRTQTAQRLEGEGTAEEGEHLGIRN
jgi:hypothetical protein